MFRDKICRDNQNIHFVLFSNFFFENLTIYEIMWKNIVERGRPLWRMRIACWIPKATDTHLGRIIAIAFSLQQWLDELASILN